MLKNEYELLRLNNHSVIQYVRRNAEIENYSILQKGHLLFETAYSQKTYQDILNIIKIEKPTVCHIHNILPLISPSVYFACKKENVPVVQTLHNYRLLCANSYLFREGTICEVCIGKSLYHSVKLGCYRDSILQTYALSRMVQKNRLFGTWDNGIDAFIALTAFSKKKFMEGGLQENKIFIKSNFLLNAPVICDKSEDYILFAGRLDITKGIEVLLEAQKKINSEIKIFIAGDGPLKNKIISVNDNYLGQLVQEDLTIRLKKCNALIFPSIWYEGMPMLILEAFACGKPVIASNLGAMADLIVDGKTGLLFKPGDAEELAKKINWANDNKDQMIQMGINARKEYEEKYTAEINYKLLMEIYKRAIENSNGTS